MSGRSVHCHCQMKDLFISIEMPLFVCQQQYSLMDSLYCKINLLITNDNLGRKRPWPLLACQKSFASQWAPRGQQSRTLPCQHHCRAWGPSGQFPSKEFPPLDLPQGAVGFRLLWAGRKQKNYLKLNREGYPALLKTEFESFPRIFQASKS